MYYRYSSYGPSTNSLFIFIPRKPQSVTYCGNPRSSEHRISDHHHHSFISFLELMKQAHFCWGLAPNLKKWIMLVVSIWTACLFGGCRGWNSTACPFPHPKWWFSSLTRSKLPFVYNMDQDGRFGRVPTQFSEIRKPFSQTIGWKWAQTLVSFHLHWSLKLSNDSLCPCICEKRLRVFVLKL